MDYPNLVFRVQSVGWRWLWFAVGLPGLTVRAAEETNGLRPPRPPLEPSFLEEHVGLVLALAGGALLVAALVLWWRRRRPRPAAGVAAEVAAQQALLDLQGQSEDAALALRVSQALRRYLHLALALPAEELTSAEVAAALRHHPLGGEELAARVAALLRDCDLWKFAPAPPPAPAGLAVRARELAQELAQRRAALSAPDPG